MKRAKIMLIAIAVVATVGGALAFKAQKFSLQNIYCLKASGICTQVAFKTTNVGPFVTTPCINDHPAAFSSSYYTTTAVPCTQPVQVAKATIENVQ